MEKLVFKRWSNRKWAILASFHKIIIIGALCVSYNMLGQEHSTGARDSSTVRMFLELEAVEALEDAPYDLENISLKSLTTVTSTEINALPAADLDDALEYLPQVDVRQRGRFGTQADLNIQGGTFDQSMVLLNGINLSDPQTGHFHLNLPVDLSAIHRFEVVLGSAARRYGTYAFSGALNVVTLPNDSTSLSSGIRVGQHNYYKAFLNTNLSGKFLSTMTSVSTSGSEGYRENTDFKSTHVYIHSATRPGKLNVQFMAGLNTRAFGANAFYSPRFLNQYEETTTGMTAVKMRLNRTRSTFTFNTYLRLNKDYFLLDRFDPAFYQNDHLTQVLGMDGDGRFSTGAGITSSGLQFRRETILSTSLGEPLNQFEINALKNDNGFDHGHDRNQISWNLNHTLEANWIALQGGILVLVNSDLGLNPFILPGLDFRIQLPCQFMIFSSVNRSMRLPTFTDLYYQGPNNVGNPALLPESALTYELGLSHKGVEFEGALNGFYRQGRDLIDWIWMDDEKWHTLNLTEIDAMGADLRLAYAPANTHRGLPRIENWNLTYTFIHLTKGSEQVISRYLLDQLKHKVMMATDLRLISSLQLSVRITFQDRNGNYLEYDPVTDQTTEQPYEPFLIMDSKLTFSLKRLHVFLESTNLLNVETYDIGNVILPGRWNTVGFEFR